MNVKVIRFLRGCPYTCFGEICVNAQVTRLTYEHVALVCLCTRPTYISIHIHAYLTQKPNLLLQLFDNLGVTSFYYCDKVGVLSHGLENTFTTEYRQFVNQSFIFNFVCLSLL